MSLATSARPPRPCPPTEEQEEREENTAERTHEAEDEMTLRVESECVAVVLKRTRSSDSSDVRRGSAVKRARPTPPSPTPTKTAMVADTNDANDTPTTTTVDRKRRRRSREDEDEEQENPEEEIEPAAPRDFVVESVDVRVADSENMGSDGSRPQTVMSPSTSTPCSPLRRSSPHFTSSTAAIATPPRPTTPPQTTMTTPSPVRTPVQTPLRTPSRRTIPPVVPASPASLSSRSSTTTTSVYHQRIADLRLRIETPRVATDSAARRSQITPPPSDRMLDRKNPPQPPRKAKKKRRLLLSAHDHGHTMHDIEDRVPLLISPARVPIARLPRLSSDGSSSTATSTTTARSSLSGDASPAPSPSAMLTLLQPVSSRVFRSLEAEFDAAADDRTPPLPLRLRPPPAIPRITRLFPMSDAPRDPTDSRPRRSSNGTGNTNGLDAGNGNGNGASLASLPPAVRVRPRPTRVHSATTTSVMATTTTTTVSRSPTVCREDERLQRASSS